MPQMINKGNELTRICPSNSHKIEYSKNGGRSWMTRTNISSCGDFLDLLDNGDELLATTTKGLYYSKNCGRAWFLRRKN